MPIKTITNEHKCEHLSPRIECNVGGNGTLECYNRHFHQQCPFKRRVQLIERRRGGNDHGEEAAPA